MAPSVPGTLVRLPRFAVRIQAGFCGKVVSWLVLCQEMSKAKGNEEKDKIEPSKYPDDVILYWCV